VHGVLIGTVKFKSGAVTPDSRIWSDTHTHYQTAVLALILYESSFICFEMCIKSAY
jgi:hypothetical protein